MWGDGAGQGGLNYADESAKEHTGGPVWQLHLLSYPPVSLNSAPARQFSPSETHTHIYTQTHTDTHTHSHTHTHSYTFLLFKTQC